MTKSRASRRAREAAAELGMRFVPGVEISVTWGGETVHVVGLQVNEDEPALVQGLAATRSGRDARGREIAAQLAAAGIPGAYEGALKYVGNPDLLSRTHFARYLVEIGACGSTPEVFRKYLTEGKPGYVPHRWASLADAVGWIRKAGGIPVIAHPGRYRFTPLAEGALFDEFKQLGGNAIEVVTGSHTPDQYRSMPKWRAATASWLRAAPISMRRASRGSSSTSCRRCRPMSRRCGTTGSEQR
jgi:predicted metal-dependent phosphoesterase TrpH